MVDEVYFRLAKVLDTLPNGFPATDTGVEIELLKKVFEPEEAELFCDLKMTFETAEQIAKRTGRPLDGLEEKLTSMWRRGQLFGVDFGTVKVFKLIPWIFGIYEFQLKRMDREFAELTEKYSPVFSRTLMGYKPQLMQVIPVETVIPNRHEALPYQKVSAIIEKGKSFGVADCICKKEKSLLGKTCRHPLEVCLGIAPVPGIFENHHWGRPITKAEAYEILRKAEESGLVHLISNVESGHYFICNCCGCCCGVLRTINELNMEGVVNSHYYAWIDPDYCSACGICATDRCQVKAIENGRETFRVIKERCIGCGLCITTCPSEAICLMPKDGQELESPPKDEKEWFRKRGQARGVDYSAYE